jgi:putative SOS response-associated peptidase YedK
VDLLRPYPAERMRALPVGNRVGIVRNNDLEMLEPVAMVLREDQKYSHLMEIM